MIVIYGAGSIGGALAGLLMQQGFSVRVKVRSSKQKQAFEKGIILEEGESLTGPFHIPASTHPSIVENAEVLCLTVQSQDTWYALAELRPYLSSNTIVCSLQNGVHNADLMNLLLQRVSSIAGAVWWSVTQYEPNRFYIVPGGSLTIGPYPMNPKGMEDTKRLHTILSTILPVNVSSIIHEELYEKLCLNTINAIFTLTASPYPEGFLNEHVRKLSYASITEAMTVLEQASIPYSTQKLNGFLEFLQQPTSQVKQELTRKYGALQGKHVVSTQKALVVHEQQATQSYQTTNTPFLTGELVYLAKTKNINAPINEALLELMHKRAIGEVQSFKPQTLSALLSVF